MGKLTVKRVAGLKDAGRYGDGQGLTLQVTATGTKSWLYRWERDGRERCMGLGSVHDVDLEEARDLAREARRAVKAGRDPIDERKAERERQRADARKLLLFRDAAQQYFNAHESRWSNVKSRGNFLSRLETYAFPHIGGLPVSEISTPDVLRVLEPIWHTKTETASRVRQYIEKVLAWATVKGFRQGDNPARWMGHLKEALPAPGTIAPDKHHAALPFAELPAFFASVATMGGMAALALRFLILTAARTGEVIGATWDEIDLDKAVWTIPAARMKMRRDHRVPLSEAAVVLLKTVPCERGNAHLFAGQYKGTALSNMAMAVLLKRMERTDITVHGFRSTFRDWAGDHTEFPREVVEAALAHAVGDATEQAYRRSDALERRRVLMEAWATYCLGQAPASNVLPMVRAAGS
ncbi:tyrosine-type recombinase/integrase [Xanthobacter autotrophicus]|uniref:tyrosine-type recombinase/integrase n=1 Tax=Xanthobacter autotrophicus TaxID=280 RepID=UPI0037294A01